MTPTPLNVNNFIYSYTTFIPGGDPHLPGQQHLLVNSRYCGQENKTVWGQARDV